MSEEENPQVRSVSWLRLPSRPLFTQSLKSNLGSTEYPMKSALAEQIFDCYTPCVTRYSEGDEGASQEFSRGA
jgi:hypothetical protein